MQDENEKQVECDCFTPKERDALKRWARQLDGWGFIGSVIRRAVVILGGAAAVLTAIKTLLGGL